MKSFIVVYVTDVWPIGTTDGSLKCHKTFNIFVSFKKFRYCIGDMSNWMCIICALWFVLNKIRKLEFMRYFGTTLVNSRYYDHLTSKYLKDDPRFYLMFLQIICKYITHLLDTIMSTTEVTIKCMWSCQNSVLHVIWFKIGHQIFYMNDSLHFCFILSQILVIMTKLCLAYNVLFCNDPHLLIWIMTSAFTCYIYRSYRGFRMKRSMCL